MISPGVGVLWHRDGSPVPEATSALFHERDGSPTGRLLRPDLLLVCPPNTLEAVSTPPAGGRTPVTLFAGRLDNRRDIRRSLESDGVEVPARPSDEALARLALHRWGPDAAGSFYGPFSALWIDAPREGPPSIVCERDPLGDQAIFYRFAGDRLAVATDLDLLLHLCEPSVEPDWTSLAHLISFRPIPRDRSFFEGVSMVPPGSRLQFGPNREDLDSRWDPPGPRPAREARLAIEELRHLLEQSVERSLGVPFDAPGRSPAVLLSGGLDSSSVAALTARHLRKAGAPPPTAFSWVFEELPNIDRPYMDAVVAKDRLDWHPIVSDELGPFSGDHPPRPYRELPTQDAYSRPIEETYRRAVAAGTHLLLTGHDGDQLFVDRGYWLRDALRGMNPGLALQGARTSIRPDRSLWASFQSLLGPLSRVVGFGGRSSDVPTPWLTTAGRDLLSDRRTGSDPRLARLVPANRRRGLLLLDPFKGLGQNVVRADAARLGVDLRMPFRDLDLVQWSLSAPAHAISGPGVYKWALRQAMGNLLPDLVSRRRVPGNLSPLFQRGVSEAWPRIEPILCAPEALWPRLVDRDWLLSRFSPRHLENGTAAAVGWHCVCLELWWRSVRETGCGRQSHPL